jgi:uncharacterized protein
MDLGERKLSLGPAPAWLIFRGSPEEAARRGTILFWHGLSASKEVQAKELRSLAEHGWLAVGLDNAGHGERRLLDFEQRFSGWGESTERIFVDLVRNSAAEAPRIIDALLSIGLARADGIGAAGISMGAFIVYRAVLDDRRIQAAAALLGSPEWRLPWPESPHLHPEKFYPTPLLSQCAGADQSVPPRFARRFHERLAPFYRTEPERLRYVEFPGAGHFMPEPDWNRLWDHTLEWFRRFIPGPDASASRRGS